MTEPSITELTLKEVYDRIADPNKITYQSWLRKLHRVADGNVRSTKRLQRSLGVPTPTIRKELFLHDFIAYDGEGYGDKFVLLANSLGERIVDENGLSTEKCLEFLTRKYDATKKRIWFSFSYDVNHILKDVPDEDLLTLLDGKAIKYMGHTIRYIPSKIFIVDNYRHYDVFSFFATNFINVVKLMLGEERVSRQLIEGKMARGTFEHWDIEDLIKYNDEELVLLVEIMTKLRTALIDVDVKLVEWYGPGAIAKYWFKKYEVRPPPVPKDVALYKALSSSYYGGRFEQIKLGKFKDVYEYDIRSAYPSVMVSMPIFKSWRRVKTHTSDRYAIWFANFDCRSYLSNGYRGALPLPVRNRDGHICFPAVGRGWYWSHELELFREQFPKAKLTVHEGYIATVGKETPFAWIGELYDYRLKLKAAGNLSHYAIKVGLNSLYGKTAQTVGSNVYHSLAWAGYITSKTRTKIARAGYAASPNSVIGFATDALFTTEKLDLPQSSNLGDWEEQYFDSGIFFQSGVYRLQTGDTIMDRYRGAPLRQGIDDLVKQLRKSPNKYPEIKIARFISHLLALKDRNAYGKYRLQFISVPHKLQIDTPYKRHYLGFIKKFDFDKGEIVYDYGKILTEEIPSLPKIWVNDVNFLQWQDMLDVNLLDEDIQSVPNKSKDKVLQKLIEEGTIAAQDSAYDSVESVETLPVVEDTSEG
jgi:hypothetical protein